MSTEDTELASPKVKLRKDGRLVMNVDGAEVQIAKYDRASGHLEFKDAETRQKMYNQIVTKITTVAKGTMPSGNRINSFGIEGEERPKIAASAPPRPRMGKLGDCTDAVVEWFFKYDPQQAYIRYGVYLDKNGDPIRRHARRLIKSVVDLRATHDDASLPWVKQGKNTQTKAPVMEDAEIVEEKNAIIARRATCLTFTPKEVVGGFEADDDELRDAVGEEDES